MFLKDNYTIEYLLYNTNLIFNYWKGNNLLLRNTVADFFHHHNSTPFINSNCNYYCNVIVIVMITVRSTVVLL